MPDNLCYSYSFNLSNYSLKEKIICPSVSWTFYADEPMFLNYQIERGLTPPSWISEQIFKNYSNKNLTGGLQTFKKNLVPVKINVTDEVVGTVNGKPFRQWKHIIEGYLLTGAGEGEHLTPSQTEFSIKGYSISAEPQKNNAILYKASVEAVRIGGDNEVKPLYDVNAQFEAPGVPDKLTCTNYSLKDSSDEFGVYVWNCTCEGELLYSPDGEIQDNLPDEEVTTSYEINGSTVRSVNGELLVLKRSENPILKKSITVYSTSSQPVATLGSSYRGGIALSENIVKETVENNGSVNHVYYRHTIEVEGEGFSSEYSSGNEGG